MRRWTTLLAALAVALAIGAPAAWAVSVQELDAAPENYAGSTVVVTGELVGDYGRRNGSVWVQLNDDAYATRPLLDGHVLAGANIGIGVQIPTALFDAAVADPPGGYQRRGPLVAITGTFHYKDPSRSGETYVEAAVIEVVARGQVLEERHHPVALTVGALLLAAAVAVEVRRRVRPRR